MLSIIDIVFLSIALVFVIIGLAKGFAKMITPALCVIFAFIASVVVAIVLKNVIQKLNLFVVFHSKMSGLFKGALMTTQITSADELSALLSGDNAGVLKVLSSLAPSIFKSMDKVSGLEITTLGDYFGYICVSAIVIFVLWLVSYLIIKYILLGIRKLLKSMSNKPVLKSIDRIFGCIWSVAWGYVFVVGVVYSAFLVVSTKLNLTKVLDFTKEIVNNSTVVKFVHSTNILGEMLAKLFKISIFTI